MKRIVWHLLTQVLQAAIALWVLAALAHVHGCVAPGPIDPSVVAQYQRAMLEAGPQYRDRPGPLSKLLPPGSDVVPKPRIMVDEQSGAARTELSLDEAVALALANNLDIRVVSYQPGISRQEVIQAAAEFDYVAFGSYDINRQDAQVNLFGKRNLRTQEFQAGVRQKTVTGAELSLTGSLTAIRDHSFSRTSRSFQPDLTLSLTQPLLRGGWSERNLASLEIARINNKVDMAAFRQQVEQTVTEVISTYWQLVQARRNLTIQEDLLVKTEATYSRVKERIRLDATAVEIKQSEAAVEIRRAALIRTRKNIRDIQDILGRLLSDQAINDVTDIEIIPTTPLITEWIAIDVTDQLVTALEHSPLLDQARLGIQAADISVRVAENEKLPKLDFVGSVGLTSGADTLQESSSRFWSGDFFNYEAGVQMEYPIGNRQRNALLRQRRYERLLAITQLQKAADDVATEVRERIRQVKAAYEEILAQRKAVAASADQLQALEDTERIRGQLTPEFLRVKLDAQVSLAASQTAELQAIIDYNTALADLDRVTGTVLEMHSVKVAMPLILDHIKWDKPTWPGDMPQEDGQEHVPPATDGNTGQEPANGGQASGMSALGGEPVDQPPPDADPAYISHDADDDVEMILWEETTSPGEEMLASVRRLSTGAMQLLGILAGSR